MTAQKLAITLGQPGTASINLQSSLILMIYSLKTDNQLKVAISLGFDLEHTSTLQ